MSAVIRTPIRRAALAIALSALIYFIHYAIFHDVHHIFIYMVGDLAFLPLEVFLVIVVVERLLARREKQATLQKLNMVVGAFFSEVGNELLQRLLVCFDKGNNISQHLAILKSAGVVGTRRDGQNIFYSIANEKILEACRLMREVLMEQISKKQKLMDRIEEGEKTA